MLNSARASVDIGPEPEPARSDERFIRYMAERLPADRPLSEGLDGLQLPHLYLAYACAQGSERAIGEVRTLLLGPIRAAAARTVSGDAIDEIGQEAMTKLLVGDGRSGPALAKYAGRGSLVRWAQTVTVRLAQSRGRKRTEQTTDQVELLADRMLDAGDPELEALKRTYRAQFKAAFRIALEGLTPRQRNLLRLELLDRLTIDAIARIQGVHPATISRWRADTRTRLLEGTRKVFTDQLNVGRDEFQSIMRLIGSQLDVSLPRLLVDDSADGRPSDSESEPDRS